MKNCEDNWELGLMLLVIYLTIGTVSCRPRVG